MKGPFDLTSKNIQNVKKEPGVYILGNKENNDKYIDYYVGRSDSDISDRLTYWLNLTQGEVEPKNDSERCVLNNRPKFYWRNYTESARQAYEQECKIYHDKKHECNDIHPAKTYSTWFCPVCNE
ncbi:MAG: hypothetical protein ACKKMO_00745 [Candidatus Nealsonbacteria bacterium]